MSVHVCKRLLTTCDCTKTFTQSACYGGHAASLWQLLTQTNACHHLDVPSSNSNFSQAAPLENWHGQPTGQLPHSKALTFERSEAWDANVRLCTSQAFPFCCKIIAKSIWNLLETPGSLFSCACSTTLPRFSKLHYLSLCVTMFHVQFGTHSHQRKTPMSIHGRNITNFCCTTFAKAPLVWASMARPMIGILISWPQHFSRLLHTFHANQKVFHQRAIQIWMMGMECPNSDRAFSTHSTTSSM